MEQLTKREKEKRIREKEIIMAAEKIFCEKGFEDAFMEDIAKESKFTRRTVYQYFPNKEELYFAVVLKGLKKLSVYLHEASKCEVTGIDKVQAYFKGFYKFYIDNPEILRLIGYLGYVKRRAEQDSKGRKEVMQFNYEIFNDFGNIIKYGQEDGSINVNFDSQKAACSFIFLMTSFFNQLSVTGDTFTQAFSLDLEDFSFFTMDLILKGIKK